MDGLTEVEALVGVAFAAAYADGAMGADEDERLTDHLVHCRALGTCTEEALREAMQKVERIARREGDAGLLKQAAAALRPGLRPTAFYLAADLVLADGEVAQDERRFIERVREHLDVEPGLAERIVDVILIRHRV